jgi:1,4-dihydroxy-2-naphthoate octaprenyltransferase
MNGNDDHTQETYKSMISISVEGIKTLVILNGGAIVALLGFLGQVANRGQQAPKAFCPLGIFVAGLIFGCTCFFTSYFTQFTLFNEAPGNKKPRSHMSWFSATLIFAILSLASFAIGGFLSLRVFSGG